MAKGMGSWERERERNPILLNGTEVFGLPKKRHVVVVVDVVVGSVLAGRTTTSAEQRPIVATTKIANATLNGFGPVIVSRSTVS
jgi:hypothetical protein